MKKIAILLTLVLSFCLVGCGSSNVQQTEKRDSAAQSGQVAENNQQKLEEGSMIKITVGGKEVLAKLESTQAAKELAELLKSGPISMSATNYGGFEKVCSLGKSLTTSNVQTTTQSGDVMLYNGNQIVIFYGSNSWSYTKIAKVVDSDISKLPSVLSGNENEVVIALV